MKTIVRVLTVCLSACLVHALHAAESKPLLTTQAASGELAGWKSYHADEDGKKSDVKLSDVWKLGDDGVLVCRGMPKGYIYTKKDYGNFVLTLEYRWPPKKKAGKGGVLIRMSGPERIWPKSLEAQINWPDAGDFWGLDGYTFDGPAARLKKLEHPQFGKLVNLKKTRAAEKPHGQWNAYKIVADGPTVTLLINGKQVNRATDCDAAPGKIVLTSEGSEIEFRNLRVEEEGGGMILDR